MTGHLGRFVLDRLLAEERAGLEEARAHLESCAECRGQLEALRAAQREVMTDEHVARGVEALLAARPVPAPGWRERLQALVPRLWIPVAAAAGIVLAVLVLRPQADEVRLKGGPRLDVFVVEGGRARPLDALDRVAPGTPLVLRAVSDRDGTVTFAGIAERGASYTIGSASFPIKRGATFEPPLSVELDETPGAERLAAFFCDEEPDGAALRAALDQAYGREPRDLTASRDPELAGCAARTVLLRRPAR